MLGTVSKRVGEAANFAEEIIVEPTFFLDILYQAVSEYKRNV